MPVEESPSVKIYVKEPLSLRTLKVTEVEMPPRFLEILEQKINQSEKIKRAVDNRIKKTKHARFFNLTAKLGSRAKRARYKTPRELIKRGIIERVSRKVDPTASLENIKRNLNEAFADYELSLDRPEQESLAREFRRVGFFHLLRLPAAVTARLVESKRELPAPKENFVPLSAKLAKLSPQSQVLTSIGKVLPYAEEPVFPGHHPFVLIAHGVNEADVQESINSMEASLQEPGLDSQAIDQTRSVIDQYRILQQRLTEFREKYPKIAQALDRFNYPERLKGLAVEKAEQIRQKLGLPELKFKALEPAKIAPPKIRTGIGRVLEPTGLVKRVSLEGGKFTYTSAIKDFFVRTLTGGRIKDYAAFKQVLVTPVKKLFTYLGNTAIGKAVIAGAKQVGKAAGQLAVKIASKLGIKLTAASLSAIIPTGVNQVISLYLLFDSVMDVIGSIPVIGKPLAALATVLSGPLGMIRLGLKAAWSIITLKPLRKGLQQLQEGDMRGALNIAIGVLPFLALAAAIFGPIVLIGGAALLGAALIIVNLGVIVPVVTAAVGTAVTAITVGTIGFLAALPTIITVRRILVPIIIILLIIGFLTVFIVVLISGGAFVITPQASPTTLVGGSTYIRLEKTASPTEIANSSIPGATVSYTITITAIGSQLTNVRVENLTQIIKPGGGTFTIRTGHDNSQADINITSWTLSPINSGGNFSISYTVILDSSHVPGFTNPDQIRDAWLTDTATVIADVPSQNLTGERQLATARVKIGNPISLGPEGWPISGWVNQGPYGTGSHGRPTVYDPRGSHAIDIGQRGIYPCNVYATHDGIAHLWSSSSCGTGVIVCPVSGCQWRTIYCHLTSVSVDEGQSVSRCTLIGNSGYSGNTDPVGPDGAHLHYELIGNPGLGTDIRNYLLPLGPSIPDGVINDADRPWVDNSCGDPGCIILH